MQISSRAHSGFDVAPLPPVAATVSPLVLADRLISLAQDADRAGFRDSASRMIVLAHQVMDDVSNLH